MKLEYTPFSDQIEVAARPLYQSRHFPETKDPDIVAIPPTEDHPEPIYRIYGSVGTSHTQRWRIGRFEANDPLGRWIEKPPLQLNAGNRSDTMCAPGLVHEDDVTNMFVQRNCFSPTGAIEYYRSTDGKSFKLVNVAVPSHPGTRQSGVDDAEPALIIDAQSEPQRYLTYSGYADPAIEPQRNDVYIRKSAGYWEGPWEEPRLLLAQEDVPHHNQPGAKNYEWGLEASKLHQLTSGRILYMGVCFLPEGEPGTRQHLFAAAANSIDEPLQYLGLLMPPEAYGQKVDEDGHGSIARDPADPDTLLIPHQFRSGGPDAPWRVSMARIPESAIEAALDSVLGPRPAAA